MNCVDLFTSRAEDVASKTAIAVVGEKTTSFSELAALAGGIQKDLRRHHVEAGDSVLVFDDMGPRLYAAVIAVVGLGARVVFVEPYLSLQEVEDVINEVKPKIFLTSFLGRLWGVRTAGIRDIPHWVALEYVTPSQLHVEPIAQEQPAIVTFTTGTTGRPKGVVRTHDNLLAQYTVLQEELHFREHPGADLCVLANFVFANLAAGRSSLIVPSWNTSVFKKLKALPQDLQPRSLVCGPAFLAHAMRFGDLSSMEAIGIGGAVADCSLFLEAFSRFPNASIWHLYGSSEAEPVAVTDARISVHESHQRGFFQNLFLGRPSKYIETLIEDPDLWVSGKHVCSYYYGNNAANERSKRKSATGQVWHLMGDRILEDDKGWWYAGRSYQNLDDFLLEQKIYSFLQDSASFLDRRQDGTVFLVGERLKGKEDVLLKAFDNLSGIVDTKVYRDRRHRARIDKTRTLTKHGYLASILS